jgi:hypothetical protein
MGSSVGAAQFLWTQASGCLRHPEAVCLSSGLRNRSVKRHNACPPPFGSPAVSCKEIRRLCAPASRRVCLYRVWLLIYTLKRPKNTYVLQLEVAPIGR